MSRRESFSRSVAISTRHITFCKLLALYSKDNENLGNDYPYTLCNISPYCGPKADRDPRYGPVTNMQSAVRFAVFRPRKALTYICYMSLECSV